MRLGRPAVFLVLSCWVLPGAAQEIAWRQYAREDGLGNLALYTLVQDRHGALWAGSENGLYRNQGAGFERFGADRGILDAQVGSLHEDGGGRMWVGSAGRLYRGEEGDRFSPVTLDGNDISILEGQRLASSADGDVLVASRGGLLRVGRDRHVAEPYFDAETVRQRPELGELHALFSSPTHGTWFGCGTAVCRIDGREVRVFGAAQGIPIDTWEGIFGDRQGRLWVRGYRHLRVLNPGASAFVPREIPGQSGVASPLQFFAQDGDGAILTRSDAGIARWRDGRWTVFDSHNGLPPYGVAAIVADLDGPLWLATRGNGVLRWIGYGEWENWTDRQGLRSTLVWQALRQSPHRLLVANDDVTMALDAGSRTFVPWRADATPQKQVNTLVRASDGAIWASSYSGEVTRHDPITGRKTSIAGLPLGARLYGDSRGRLWILTSQGIYRIERPEAHAVAERMNDPVLPVELYNDMAEAPDGSFYFVSAHGVFRYQRDRWARIEIDDPRSRRGFYTVACSQDGTVWIGISLAGLVHVRPQGDRADILAWWTVPAISSAESLFLSFDSRGWLWAGSDRGVDVFNGARWRHLTVAEGLLWDDMSQGAFSIDPDGSIWLGTSRGLSHVLQPERLFDPPRIEIRIDAAAVGATSLSLDAETEVPWSHSALTIEFSSPSFRFEKGLRFRYRLVGIDEGWQETGARSLRYPSLPAGEFRFELQAFEPNTGASSAVAALSFKMQAPWWRSSAFFAALGGLFLGAGLIGFRLRTRSMLAEQKRLERLVAERTRELDSEKRELAAARDALVIRATRDALTGLWNRSAILERLEQEVARAERDNLPLTVVLADLDHFKSVNDTFGHQAGDEVLCEVARRLSARVRPYDLIGRYGGEEILIILPGLGGDPAARRLAVLHRAISETPVEYESLKIRATLSCGVATFQPGLGADALVREADRALYRAKAQGRNRVELGTGPRRFRSESALLAPPAGHLIVAPMKITFLGTGLMGTGFVRGLLGRGHEVTVWNRSRDKAQALAGEGAKVAANPAQAVTSAERLFLSLNDDTSVDAVLAEALPALPAQVPIVDLTTTAPLSTRARADRLAAAGRRFFHAPVFMSPENARLGQGIMLGAGPEEVHAALAPELSKMTGTFWYLGPDGARAAAFKLFGNAMFFAVTAGLADVFAVGKAVGIAPAEVLELFQKLDPSSQIKFRGPRMARGDFKASFELAMARKDTRLMIETAAGQPLAILPAIAARMDALIGSGHGQDDLGVLGLDAIDKR